MAQQTLPSVAAVVAGKYLVVCTTRGQDGAGNAIFGRRYNAAGVALGTEFQINSNAAGDQTRAKIAMAPDGRFVVRPGAVRQVIAPVGHDIYGNGEVQRRVYELQASITPGTSGGPFVLPDGTVAGVVFASSLVDDRTAYALISPAVRSFVQEAAGRVAEVGSGRCVL